MERTEAVKLGLSQYTTGRPCGRGHLGPRYLNGTCRQCVIDSSMVRYRTDTEGANRRSKAYYQKNRAKMIAQTKKWREANKGRYDATKKRWRSSTIHGYLCSKINLLRASKKSGRCDCTVDTKYLLALYYEQEGKCALTGRQLEFKSHGKSLDTLSIDRIDSSKGYVEGNIRMVTLQANNARMHGTDEQLFKLCQDILKNSARGIDTTSSPR